MLRSIPSIVALDFPILLEGLLDNFRDLTPQTSSGDAGWFAFRVTCHICYITVYYTFDFFGLSQVTSLLLGSL
jgi:hypothetical protein